MGKRSPSPPPPPDPNALIAAQQGSNRQAIRDAALINQFNQITPFGSRTFSGELGTPNRLETISLSPSSQRQLDTQNAIAESLLGLARQSISSLPTNALNLDGIPNVPAAGSLNESALQVEQAVFDRSRRLLDEAFGAEQRRLESNLAVRGIPLGSEAYRRAFDDLNQRRRDALLGAAQDAVVAGRSEQSRQIDLGLRQRQQALGELLTQRGQPFNEIAALLGGAPAFQVPQFPQAPAVPTLPIDAIGANTQAQNSAFRNFTTELQGDPSGLLGLGLTFLRGVI